MQFQLQYSVTSINEKLRRYLAASKALRKQRGVEMVKVIVCVARYGDLTRYPRRPRDSHFNQVPLPTPPSGSSCDIRVEFTVNSLATVHGLLLQILCLATRYLHRPPSTIRYRIGAGMLTHYLQRRFSKTVPRTLAPYFRIHPPVEAAESRPNELTIVVWRVGRQGTDVTGKERVVLGRLLQKRGVKGNAIARKIWEYAYPRAALTGVTQMERAQLGRLLWKRGVRGRGVARKVWEYAYPRAAVVCVVDELAVRSRVRFVMYCLIVLCRRCHDEWLWTSGIWGRNAMEDMHAWALNYRRYGWEESPTVVW